MPLVAGLEVSSLDSGQRLTKKAHCDPRRPFNVFSARSDEQSAFVHAFRNAWLWTAIAGSVALQMVVVYVPFLQNAYGTTSLNVSDWILCFAVASSVLWLREGTKAVLRRGKAHTSE
jgi:magnesium-transporting ATPase (P-type)